MRARARRIRDSSLRRLVESVGEHRDLLTNAGSMVGTTLATSLLGVVFWFVAARYFSPSAVGVAGASVSGMLLFGFVAALGLGTLLMGELPRRQEGRRALLNASLLTSLAAGLALGVAFALLAPLLTSSLSPLQQTVGAVLVFAVGTGLTGMTYVLDQALVGLLRGGLQLSRNVIFAAAKLLGLILVSLVVVDPGPAYIYAAWAAGILVSLVVLVPFFARRGGESLRPDFVSLHSLRRPAASHAAVNLALEIADLAMPIIVVSLITPAENAGFYIAWLVVGFLVMIPLSLSSVAFAIGSGEGGGMENRFRFTFSLSLALGLAASLVLIPGAGPILGIFGPDYADTATGTLKVLALGVFPLTVKTHYVAIHRVRRTLRRALPVAWAGTVFELGGGAVGGAVGGITGVAWGWLGGLLLEACVMSGDVRSVCLPRRRRAAPKQVPQQEDRGDQGK